MTSPSGDRTHKIAAIPADGIGPEVIGAGLEVLHALQQRSDGLRFEITQFDWGSDYYREHGKMMPEDGLAQLRKHDAIYFGAVGAPDIADHITLWGLRLPICQGFDQYANVRPTRILPGIPTPLRDRGSVTSTGLSSARTRKASTPATAAAHTEACQRKWLPR